MDPFAFDAPIYFDFSNDLQNEDAEKLELFFETKHVKHNNTMSVHDIEYEKHDNKTPTNEIPKDCSKSSLEFYTPRDFEKPLQCNLRKSISLEQLELIRDGVANLKIPSRKKSSKAISTNNRPRIFSESRLYSISGSSVDKLAMPKYKVTPFVSMAEAIQKFYQKTPTRFHSKGKVEFKPSDKLQGPLSNTIPHSPKLTTKNRVRSVSVVSREEQEMKEFDEMKKYKIKANPVNTKVLYGEPFMPEQVKHVTIPEPFHLTEVPKKIPTTPPLMIQPFHAKVVPKSVLEPPKPILKSNLHTIAHTPKFMKRDKKSDYTKLETTIIGSEKFQDKTHGQPLKPTKPIPFSFEQRNKNLMKKREELLHNVIEQENKARVFHAKPVPKYIFRLSTLKNNERQYKSAENLSTTIFKAKPAKVLHQKPFEPKKDDNHLIEITEFQLNCEDRAKKRMEFEKLKKEKEERTEQLIREREELRLKSEEEKIVELRKQTLHKAQPIRRYKEVKSVPARKVTEPVTPKFSTFKNKNKENSC